MIKIATIALAAIVVIMGLLLPVSHTASAEAAVAAGPERVFAMLGDVERFPKWRSGLTTVDVLSRQPLRWRESGRDGTITFEQVDAEPNRRLVTRIADPSLPFGGS